MSSHRSISDATGWLIATVIGIVAAVLFAVNGAALPTILMGVMAAIFLYTAFRARSK